MKLAAVLRGGGIAAIAAVAMLIAAGWLLELNVSPAVLLAVAIALGIASAFVCALVFEYVTEYGGWLIGTAAGVLVGVTAAAAAGLLPWLAAQFHYSYMPAAAPFGPHDPSWVLAVLVLAGIVCGAIAGKCYGRPLHASRPSTFAWREIYPTTRR